MAVIHRTTLTPTKLELLTEWLPAQPWYAGGDRQPELAKAGGFRLDDPKDEVGIEFMAVTDASGDRPVTYQVPLTYRGAPLEGAREGLIGTTEHGVLGRRWVYDGTHDPVLVTRLIALMTGDAEPQQQSISDTPDPSVTGEFTGPDGPAVDGLPSVVSGPDGSDIQLRSATSVLHVHRVLRTDQAPSGRALGRVTGDWLLPDGTGTARGEFFVVRDAADTRPDDGPRTPSY